MRLFMFLLFVIGAVELDAASVHAVIVCDTVPEDIAKTVRADMKNICEQARLISAYTSLKLNLTCLSGAEANPKRVKKVLDSLQVESDDLVFFYFTGHGFRTFSKGDNPWPNLFFQSVYVGMDFEWIVKRIRSKHPRLLLAFADCCNSYYPENSFPMYPFEVPFFSKSKKRQNNYRQLFEYAQGEVLGSAAKRGQQAWGYPSGGVFTSALLRAIDKHTESSKWARWQVILDQAAYKSSEWQTPMYSVDVQERSRAPFLYEAD